LQPQWTLTDIRCILAQDVLVTLLNNLKVQERQNRVCTTVAIAIVAETCSPFTVLPALMNEYRTPELNVQASTLPLFAASVRLPPSWLTCSDYACVHAERCPQSAVLHV
jgi:hypothetical protein